MTIVLCLAMSFLFFTPIAAAQQSKMIIINKRTNQLGFYQNGILTKVFPVATGRQRSYTPEGKFKVMNKIVNPTYYKKNIPGGSPYNPLGPRWLGLSAPGGSYGIHGNSNPRSIGTYASNGCIRLKNEDILWLYEQVPVGTPVIIVWNDTDLASGFIDNTPIKVYFNSETLTLANEDKTFSQQERPYIPLKLMCQLLGYNITWNNETQTIDLDIPGVVTRLTPNSKSFLINNQSATLTDPPVVINGITYVTKSTIEELFTVNVTWQPASRELHILLQTHSDTDIQEPKNKASEIENNINESWLPKPKAQEQQY